MKTLSLGGFHPSVAGSVDAFLLLPALLPVSSRWDDTKQIPGGIKPYQANRPWIGGFLPGVALTLPLGAHLRVSNERLWIGQKRRQKTSP